MAAQWYHCTWSTIHHLALGYPEFPSPEEKTNYRAFFQALGPVLPCKKCSINYQRHLLELPIEPYLTNTNTLFEWTVKLHNIVNRENHKPEWTVEQARAHYLNQHKPNNQWNIVAVITAVFLVIMCFAISMLMRYKSI
jgi:hypothetical protein